MIILTVIFYVRCGNKEWQQFIYMTLLGEVNQRASEGEINLMRRGKNKIIVPID